MVGTRMRKLTMLGHKAEWWPWRKASHPATRITANRPELPESAAAQTERNAAIENGARAERSVPFAINVAGNYM